jgi:hypothetical protein
MKTRSQNNNNILFKDIRLERKQELKKEADKKENIILYMVEIDFDEASECWKSNKKRVGNGCYKYVCCKKTKSGNQCKREAIQGLDCCNLHKNQK